MREEITRWLIENSPPESGPVYRALAENWDIVQQGLTILLACIVVMSLSFAAAVWSAMSEEV